MKKPTPIFGGYMKECKQCGSKKNVTGNFCEECHKDFARAFSCFLGMFDLIMSDFKVEK